jgi:hypothetical protein
MINTNPELIVPYTLPDTTSPIGQGEHFDDVLMLSLRSLNHWFVEPNRVKVIESYKLGELPMLVVRYANKKLAILVDYLEDYTHSKGLKVDGQAKYTEALSIYATVNKLFPVIAVVLSFTNKKDIERNKKIIKAKVRDKEGYLVEPILMITETPPNQLRIRYPYPLETNEKPQA